ncbi:MAG: hypothetical protein Q7J68_00405 [Thermoplasmata archaeon]|nr:hypothetical protein [Thermoplasmata archaeon]
MLPIAHLIISIGIAFCLEYKHPRRISIIVLLGLIGTLPDFDHFLPMYNGAKMFHNLFFLAVLPILLLFLAHFIETRRTPLSSVYQRFIMCATVVLVGHLILDAIAGNTISPGFPTSSFSFSLNSAPILTIAEIPLANIDIMWILLAACVIFGRYAQREVYDIFEAYAIEDRYIARHSVSRRDVLNAIIVSPVRRNANTPSG